MRSIQRRQRHKSLLKRAILDSALEIIEKEGYHAVTIRKIANAIEYSVPTIYEHFENKDTLLGELKKEWLRKMLDLIQEIHAGEKEPKAALEKIALAYARNALENGQHYKAVMETEDKGGSFVEIHTLRTILKEWIQDATKGDRNLDNKVDLFRGYLHGIVSLALTKKLQGGEDRCVELVKEGLSVLIKAWKQ
jgi:AcrR family transcriptional regulator